LQVNKLYAPEIGGVERTVQLIAEGLRDRVAGEVLACRVQGRGREDCVNGVPVHRVGSLGRVLSMPLSPALPLRLRGLSRRFDLVHFHAPFPLGEVSLFLLPRALPAVVTWHSDIIRQKLLFRIYRRVLHRFLQRVDLVMVTSPMQVQASPSLGAVADKCRVVPLGIDPARFELDAAGQERARAARRRFGDPLVLFVGRLVYYKGLEYLVTAMRDVNANLLIVGSGPLRGALERQVQRLGLTARVHFVDVASDADVVTYLHACDAFVLPSVHNSEAFGLVQVEAMACGKPVVNTALPTGVPFVSVDGMTGLTVPPRDAPALAAAIGRLLEDRALRERLGAGARARVDAEFTLRRMLDRVLDVYREALAAGAARCK
jgi:rhamnosyl/mannosyltransferase